MAQKMKRSISEHYKKLSGLIMEVDSLGYGGAGLHTLESFQFDVHELYAVSQTLWKRIFQQI